MVSRRKILIVVTALSLSGPASAGDGPKTIRGPGTYPPGLYKGPCEWAGDDSGGEGVVHRGKLVKTSFFERHTVLEVLPPDCAPVHLGPGKWTAEVYTANLRWVTTWRFGKWVGADPQEEVKTERFAVDVPLPKVGDEPGGRRLVARAGGPYRVERGKTVLLDGSGSTREADHRWTFEGIGDCVTRPGAEREGLRTRVLALCPFRATLTVEADDAEPASASAEVQVEPRRGDEWKPTPVPTTVQDWTNPSPAEEPRPVFTGSEVISAWEFAQNVCALHGTETTWGADRGILHPHRDHRAMVEVGQVDDEGGPFHEYAYAVRVTAQVVRKAVFNRYVYRDRKDRPDGRFNYYEFNKAALGSAIDRYYRAVERHEGEGTGQERTGHTQVMRDALRGTTTLKDGSSRPNDPRMALEDRWAKSPGSFRELARRELERIDSLLARESSDDLVAQNPEVGDFVWFAERRCWWRIALDPATGGRREDCRTEPGGTAPSP